MIAPHRLVRHRSGPRARAGGVLLCRLAALALVVASCGPSVPSPVPGSPAGRPPPLVVLGIASTGSPVGVVQGDIRRPIPPPSGTVQWIAASVRGELVATLTDGSIVRTTGPLPDDPRWVAVPLPAVIPRDPPLSFAVPAPAGGVVAAISATYGTGEPSSLAVLATGGSGTVVRLPIEANGAAPAWLDSGRLIVAGLLPDGAAGAAFVDTSSGTVAHGPGGIRAVAVSSAMGRAAIVGADGRMVTVVDVERIVAAGATGASGPSPSTDASAPLGERVPPPDSIGIATALALDETGRWLAVVWTDADLAPSILVTFLDDGGWHETSRSSLGPGARAAVAWLPRQGIAMPP